MKKSWWKKFRHRTKKNLRSWEKLETAQDSDDGHHYKLVSVTLINLGLSDDKKKRKGSKKGLKNPPVSGNALYYVAEIGEEVKLLHTASLKVCRVGRRQFETSVTDVWWPTEAAKVNPDALNRFGMRCNRFQVAETMLRLMKNYADKQEQFAQETVRAAIADLKEIPLDQVPKYKIETIDPSAHLKAWRENMAGYKQRAGKDLKRLETEGESMKDEKNKKGKKAKGKSSKKADKAKSKKSTKESKGKAKDKAPKEPKFPKGKSSKATIINALVKAKGKTISVEDLQKIVTKAKGTKRQVTDKKIKTKIKEVKTWAGKNNFKLEEGKKGFALKSA